MTGVDWSTVLPELAPELALGLAVGVPVSSLFFAGLAWGMTRALTSERPEGLLLLSAVLRLAMLLGVGAWLAASTATAWPMLGYAVAFFIVRTVAVTWARAGQNQAGKNQAVHIQEPGQEQERV
ncbi:MAG: N-ATPase subunit AtpR [Halomonas sp.]|uniref:N-ATPase subunit AtpR n=1 Tax=Halomonas sp. TaxID=1486246 RepID=UPI003F8FE094